MTSGSDIAAARKRHGKTQQDLAGGLGIPRTTLADIERKDTVDPNLVIRVSEILDDVQLLSDHIARDPVRLRMLSATYPAMNRINRDPACMIAVLIREMTEAIPKADELAQLMRDLDFQDRPGYREAFQKAWEQILDVERCIQEIKLELLRRSIHTWEDLADVYRLQNEKCIAHGHHRPEE